MQPWINTALQQFDNIIRNNKLPHALMIYGNKHIGKLTLAQHIVEKITSVSVTSDNLDIGDNNKILIRNSNYKGLIYCQKELAKNSRTKQASKIISVEQIRAFNEFLGKTSEKIQIGIINTGDDLHISAANALLKTLEEPRKNTLIIILANNPDNLPITITSRCQKLHLYADDSAVDWLEQKLTNVDKKTIKKLLKESNYTPDVVVKKFQNKEVQQEKIWKKQLLSMAINPNNINVLENIKGNEIKIITCLENMLIACIELKIAKTVVENKLVHHILQNTQSKMFFNLLADTSRAKSLANTNINISLLLDNLLIVWSHITHLQTYPEITFKKL